MHPHSYIQERWSLVLCTALMSVLVCTLGCTAPVGVKRLRMTEAHLLLTASALPIEITSQHSLHVLSQLNLLATFQQHPSVALIALHAKLQSVADPHQQNNLLFALAELSFLHAEQRKQRLAQGQQCHAQKGRMCPSERSRREAEEQVRAYYFAAAVYAYAFLFPESPQHTPLDPADPRLRLAYDLYNRGLTEGLLSPKSDEVVLVSGRHLLPFGMLDIQFMSAQFSWAGYQVEHFVPTANLAVHGLRNRYRRPGIGVSLAASLAEAGTTPSVTVASRIPPRLKVPVTAFLRIAAPRRSLVTGALRGQLELYAADQVQTVTISGQEQPLEFETTAALAYTLAESRAYAFEISGFLRGVLKSYIPHMQTQDGLFFVQPPSLDRIPLVLVHGTASSPARWAELMNEIESVPHLRDRYQIWLFIYDTGNPIAYSGRRLRQALQNVVHELDPQGTATALQHMVVIGHSQGGLLAKLTAINSGTRFWNNLSETPLEQLTLESETRDLLRHSLFVTPLPFVKRIVFIATPHRGSYQAALRLGRLASWFVTLPADLSTRALTTLTQNPGKLLIQHMEKLPTSIDNMNPSHPFIKTLASIPIADGIKAHSIIPVLGAGTALGGNDGVVEYDSAHINGVDSELVVRFGHSVQSHPQVIEEIWRILTDHLDESFTFPPTSKRSHAPPWSSTA